MTIGIKNLLLPILLLLSVASFGQKITGAVINEVTRQPVSGALITAGNARTLSDLSGRFEIVIPASADSLKIAHFAYKTYAIAITKAAANLHIELEPAVISLKDVTVRGTRDFKKDSIENRLAYAKEFNYVGPTVKDAFSSNPNKQPGELISINPLLLIAALTKKRSPEYKFHKMLIQDEQADYVDRKFNKGIVSRITGLKGDTLSAFLTRYRPAYQFALKASDYDMDIYIKESLKKFQKEGMTSFDMFQNAKNRKAEPIKLN